MSGDVQPRKRKDKKKKKDELGLEEPRGTAAVLGEGDVFLHSQQDHGTGGHWCAKIIFFSLLAVLITLIGLIILENRGLSELEANSVESRYSGVLEGWLEDAADDDHHDVHTLELKNHDDDDDEHDREDDEHEFDHDNDEDEEHSNDFDDDEDDEHADHDDDDEDEEHTHDDRYEDEQDQDDGEREDPDDDDNDEDDLQNEDREDQDVDAAYEEDEAVGSFRKYFGFGFGGDKHEESEENTEKRNEERDDNNEDDNEDTFSNELNSEDEENDNDEENYVEDKLHEEDDLSKENENHNENSFENFDIDDDDNDDDNTLNNYNEKDEDDHDEDENDDDEDTEVERIEREVSQEEPISMELPALPEDDDDNDKDQDQEDPDDEKSEDDDVDPGDGDNDDEFLEADDEPPVERITAPSGRPFEELEEEDVSTEKPPDTLKEEEEYEKKQEELRQEQEQSSHMWLKLVVGAALLAATHAVMRRATAPPDETESDEHISREETPVVDRRMTLIPVPEEPSEPEATQKASKTVEEFVKKTTTAIKHAPPPEEDSEQEDLEDEEVEMEEQEKDDEKELFSEEEPEDEPEQEDEIVQARKETPKQAAPNAHESTPDDEVGDDVEIIDDDQLEEELEDEEDDEEISDVDDAELLTRLEAKYGRLPEPDRPAPKHSKRGSDACDRLFVVVGGMSSLTINKTSMTNLKNDGGNSIEDEWPGEPEDPFWRQQLDSAERNLRQGEYAAATRAASAPQLAASTRARWVLARALDVEAEARRDNRILTRAIAAYINLLKMSERLSDKKLIEITNRTLERIQFRGNYLSAEPVYKLLIRRFPDDVTYRNKLTVSYLMANRPDLADEVLKETLRLWPNDRVALAHYGFVLKTQHNKLEEAVVAFQKALEGDQGPACEPRFYYHLGDALLLLGRFSEAHDVHKRGAKIGHFLSPAQRSLYNVPRLRGKPWWDVADTPYVKLARALEKSWREILNEGLAAQALYEREKEGLRERGDWSQLDLFVRGQEIPGRCKQAPVTCSVVKGEAAAAGCRRGQIKFSAMAPGTHVRPHVGPTNCRLRMHLGLSNTKDTYLRVDQETRQWQEGKVLLFDDSFEHEVWHNGTGQRLVLIVDVWHPDLTPAERRQLPAI